MELKANQWKIICDEDGCNILFSQDNKYCLVVNEAIVLATILSYDCFEKSESPDGFEISNVHEGYIVKINNENKFISVFKRVN